MPLHLTHKSFFLANAAESDKFVHDVSIWFNAAVSATPSWMESKQGSGYAGLDRVCGYHREDFGNLKSFNFWGYRRKPADRK